MGIKYLIAELDYIKEPNNYGPVTCLSTVYKMLTGIIASRISSHLEQYSLSPAEQTYFNLEVKDARIIYQYQKNGGLRT
jgi:hypothetical protein